MLVVPVVQAVVPVIQVVVPGQREDRVQAVVPGQGVDRRVYSPTRGPDADGFKLSPLSPLSLDSSSSDPLTEERGDGDASTFSNLLFRMPLIAPLHTWTQRGH